MPDITNQTLVEGLTWYLVFVVSTSCHEAAHAWVALLGGDPTASRGGQATVNPLPHIRREPVGMVVAPIVIFLWTAAHGGAGWMMGWASAPYDPFWASRHPKRAALMSLAGPLANFALAGIAFGALKIGLAQEWFETPARATLSRVVEAEGAAAGVAHLLSIALMLNVLLGIFNLIPLPPLDGHAVVPLFLSTEAARSWSRLMRGFGFVGIILAWIVLSRWIGPIFSFVLELLHPGHRFG
jgi:Zn-dependent protease